VTRRSRRRLVALSIAGAAFLYLQGATWLERGAIAAQAPAAATGEAVARYVDRERLMRDLATLANPDLGGRRTGSEGGIKARQWIVSQFEATGLTPAGDRGYLQPFSFTHESVRGLLTPGQPYRTEYRDAANVIGQIGGRGGARPIVVSAHYDHLGTRDGRIYAGADDNASGIAALLAAARYFAANQPRHPITFAAFDAEELGLRGASAFVSSRPERRNAVLNVNLDMVSRNDRGEIYAAGTYHYPQLRPVLEQVQKRAAVQILFGHDRPMRLAGRVEDWTNSSDHAAFHAAGIPFVYFGVEDHPDYHEPTDTADKVDRDFAGAVADMVIEAIRAFDQSPPAPLN
jgi:acetylornithine deacetylase/succinyl-diaminopimelate desuccinylase-like protein